jgi:hypothetical protein
LISSSEKICEPGSTRCLPGSSGTAVIVRCNSAGTAWSQPTACAAGNVCNLSGTACVQPDQLKGTADIGEYCQPNLEMCKIGSFCNNNRCEASTTTCSRLNRFHEWQSIKVGEKIVDSNAECVECLASGIMATSTGCADACIPDGYATRHSFYCCSKQVIALPTKQNPNQIICGKNTPKSCGNISPTECEGTFACLNGTLKQDPEKKYCSPSPIPPKVTCYEPEFIPHANITECVAKEYEATKYGNGCPWQTYSTYQACRTAINKQSVTVENVSCNQDTFFCYSAGSSAYCQESSNSQSSIQLTSCLYGCNPDTGTCRSRLAAPLDTCLNGLSWCQNDTQYTCLGGLINLPKTCENGCDPGAGLCRKPLTQVESLEEKIERLYHVAIIPDYDSTSVENIELMLTALEEALSKLPASIRAYANTFYPGITPSNLINGNYTGTNGLTYQQGDARVFCSLNSALKGNEIDAYQACVGAWIHEIGHNTDDKPMPTKFCSESDDHCTAIEAFVIAAEKDPRPIHFNSDGTVNEETSDVSLYFNSGKRTDIEFFAEYHIVFIQNPEVLKQKHPEIYSMFYAMYYPEESL